MTIQNHINHIEAECESHRNDLELAIYYLATAIDRLATLQGIKLGLLPQAQLPQNRTLDP